MATAGMTVPTTKGGQDDNGVDICEHSLHAKYCTKAS